MDRSHLSKSGFIVQFDLVRGRNDSAMLSECIGSKLNNIGPSYVTLTFPPHTARRLTVTTSHQFYELHTSIHSDRKRFT